MNDKRVERYLKWKKKYLQKILDSSLEKNIRVKPDMSIQAKLKVNTDFCPPIWGAPIRGSVSARTGQSISLIERVPIEILPGKRHIT